MSTISDALKKVQQQRAGSDEQRGRGDPEAGRQPVPPPLRHDQEPPRKRNGLPVVVALLVLAMVVALAFGFWGSLRQRIDTIPIREPPARIAPVAPLPLQVPLAASSGSPAPDAPTSVVSVSDSATVLTRLPVSAPALAAVSLAPEAEAVPGKTQTVVAAAMELPAAPPASSLPPPPSAARVSRAMPTDLPVLSGTFYSPRNPVAILNGSTLSVGGTVGVYEVVRIEPESVTLKSDGQEYVVRLK